MFFAQLFLKRKILRKVWQRSQKSVDTPIRYCAKRRKCNWEKWVESLGTGKDLETATGSCHAFLSVEQF